MDLLPNVEVVEPAPEPKEEIVLETSPKESPFIEKNEANVKGIHEKKKLIPKNENINTELKPEKKPKRPKKPMSEKQLAHMARMRELAAERRLEKQKLKDLEAEQEATTARVDIQELKTEQIRKTKPRRQTPKSPPPSPKPTPQPKPQYHRTDEELATFMDSYLERKERAKAEKQKTEQVKKQAAIQPKVFNPFNYETCF